MKVQLVCLLLVLVSAAVLSQNVQERNKAFMSQHVNGQVGVNSCTSAMQSRGLAQSASSGCKKANTFIVADPDLVNSVCGEAGEPYKNGLRISLQPFSTIVCEPRMQIRIPYCAYRGLERSRKIVIGCEDGLPVSFVDDV